MQSAIELAQPLIDRLRAEIAGRETPLFVALDGRSGSGKSTIAAVVADALDTDAHGSPIVTVIEGDQFYGGGSGETWDRKSAEEKVAQVIDWQRQRLLLTALRDIGVATWLAFDWDSDDWDADVVPLAPEPIQCCATPVVLLEGAYSARAELSDLLDLRVLLDVPREVRSCSLVKEKPIRRNGKNAGIRLKNMTSEPLCHHLTLTSFSAQIKQEKFIGSHDVSNDG